MIRVVIRHSCVRTPGSNQNHRCDHSSYPQSLMLFLFGENDGGKFRFINRHITDLLRPRWLGSDCTIARWPSWSWSSWSTGWSRRSCMRHIRWSGWLRMSCRFWVLCCYVRSGWIWFFLRLDISDCITDNLRHGVIDLIFDVFLLLVAHIYISPLCLCVFRKDTFPLILSGLIRTDVHGSVTSFFIISYFLEIASHFTVFL